MRAKAAITGRIEIDVNIMCIRRSCFVKNFVNEVEQALNTRSKGGEGRKLG